MLTGRSQQLVPTLPISSLGIKRGDALVVSSASRDPTLSTNKTKLSSAASLVNPRPAASPASVAGGRSGSGVNTTPMVPPQGAPGPPTLTAEVDDSVPVDGGHLVLRVWNEMLFLAEYSLRVFLFL